MSPIPTASSGHGTASKASEEFSSIIQERLGELSALISTEENTPALSLETLLDTFLAVFQDCKAASNQNEQIVGFIQRYNPIVTKLEAARINTKDFETIKTLATGAVGRVCLVRSKKNKQVYAMKILKKHDLLTRQEAAFFMEERNALVFSQKSEWITTLYASFQDEENLYLVMEYVAGSSFRALLNTRQTIMEESDARFYMAEMVLALAEIHNHNFIHRDVKPENYLLDARGHIKLADFGSCIRFTGKLISSQITVGTPDYISPEILRANEGHSEYGQEVDWWSLGIILYELLCDEVPFYAESLVGTYGRIMNHETTFVFPDEPELSPECKDLISKLICKRETRLGHNSVDEIKNHPWFNGTDWEDIRNTTAPFIPELSGPEDTRYFEDEENETKKFVKKALAKTKEFSGNSLAFVGYNYVHNSTALVHFPIQGQAALMSTAAASSTSKIPTNNSSNDAELKSLKEKLSKEMESKRELESKINANEALKVKHEMEAKQTKLAHDRLCAENKELTSKMLGMDASSSKADANLIQELSEIKSRLEKDISQLSVDLRSQKEEVMKAQLALADSNASRAVIETKLKDLTELITNLNNEKGVLVEKALQKDVALAEKEKEVTDLQFKASKSLSELETQAQDIKIKADEIQNFKGDLEEQRLVVEKLEKAEILLKLEIENTQSRLTEALGDISRMTQELLDVRNSAKTTSSSEVESLQAQLGVQTQARAKISEDLSAALKSKALLEIEVSNFSKAKILAQKVQDDLNERIVQLDSRVSELAKSIQIMESQKKESELQLATLGKDLLQAQSSCKNLLAAKAELDEILEQREMLYDALSKTHNELKAKFKLEVELAQSLEEKIRKLEEDLRNERKLRISLDSENVKNQLEIAKLSENAKTNMDLEDEILSLQTNHKILILSLESERSIKEKLNTQIINTDINFNNLQSDFRESQKEKVELDGRIGALTLRIDEITKESDYRQSKLDEMAEKIEELEKENEVLKTKVDISGQQSQPSIGDGALLQKKGTASKSSDKIFSRSRMSGIFFKSKENLNDIPDKISIDDDHHKRMQSHQSFQSAQSLDFMRGALSAIVKASPLTVLDFFNPLDGLHGMVKVPKGGKVKKGWKLLYLAHSGESLLSYESQEDFLTETNPTFVCSISCEIFVARSVSQNELIHASARDIDLIFKIQAYTPKHSDLAKEDAIEVAERVSKLKTSIELEEKMLEATKKILGATSDAQKVVVIGQIDAANKRLRTFKQELEKISTPRRGHTINSSEIDQESLCEDLRRDLEAQLEDEMKKLDALNKLASSDKTKKNKNHDQAKDIEVEILVSDRVIAKTRESIDILKSNNQAKKTELVSKYQEQSAQSDSKGHVFSQRQYFKPTDCGICSEPLWDTKNMGYECSSCKLICHKGCRAHLDISCQNQSKLKNIPPLYFMATDALDRSRWLAGFAFLRKEIEARSSSPSGGASLPRLKSILEPTARMSMSPSPRKIHQ